MATQEPNKNIPNGNKKQKLTAKTGLSLAGIGGKIPVTTQAVNVPLGRQLLDMDQIQTYGDNPRIAPNEKFEEIKASILAVGLDQPLVVTKKPSEEHYIIYGGGNTRLMAIKELIAEGHQKFKQLECIVKPFDSEQELYVAHLRENSMRADLSFYEQVRSIVQYKQIAGLQSAKAVEIIDALAKGGYVVSKAAFSRYASAMDLLEKAPVVAKTNVTRSVAEDFSVYQRGYSSICAVAPIEIAPIEKWYEQLGFCLAVEPSNYTVRSITVEVLSGFIAEAESLLSEVLKKRGADDQKKAVIDWFARQNSGSEYIQEEEPSVNKLNENEESEPQTEGTATEETGSSMVERLCLKIISQLPDKSLIDVEFNAATASQISVRAKGSVNLLSKEGAQSAYIAWRLVQAVSSEGLAEQLNIMLQNSADEGMDKMQALEYLLQAKGIVPSSVILDLCKIESAVIKLNEKKVPTGNIPE